MAAVFAERVDTVGWGVVWDAVDESIRFHQEALDNALGLFCETTTEFKTRYELAYGAELQETDVFGRARPIQPAGYYDVSFPWRRAGIALASTVEDKATMKVQEAHRATVALMEADARWNRKYLLAALFNSANYNFVDDAHGTLAIKPLANGDGDLYLRKNSDTAAVDTHFQAQAAAIADATNPYSTIRAELLEHPENGGEVLVLIASSLVDTTRALAEYKSLPDMNVQPGANTDVVVASRLGVAFPGTLKGYLEDSQVWIAEWESLPAGYGVATTTAPRDKALRMREHEVESLRGFAAEGNRDNWPYSEVQWVRRRGYGAYNRVGAHALYVGGGAWAVPAGLTLPGLT
jgi:hypothetical protein